MKGATPQVLSQNVSAGSFWIVTLTPAALAPWANTSASGTKSDSASAVRSTNSVLSWPAAFSSDFAFSGSYFRCGIEEA